MTSTYVDCKLSSALSREWTLNRNNPCASSDVDRELADVVVVRCIVVFIENFDVEVCRGRYILDPPYFVPFRCKCVDLDG